MMKEKLVSRASDIEGKMDGNVSFIQKMNRQDAHYNRVHLEIGMTNF